MGAAQGPILIKSWFSERLSVPEQGRSWFDKKPNNTRATTSWVNEETLMGQNPSPCT